MADHRDLMKKLIAAPYGKAQDILKENGLWDEKKCNGDPTQVKTYRVRVSGQMDVTGFVSVEATNEDEACEKAYEIAEGPRFEWKDYGDVDVTDAEVESRSL